MWIVFEACGIACVIVCYLTVFTVQVAFIRIGVWDDLLAGNPWAYFHLAIFLFNVSMIIASHLKCMLSEPGVLPKDYEELDGSKLPPELNAALTHIQNALMSEEESATMSSNTTQATVADMANGKHKYPPNCDW